MALNLFTSSQSGTRGKFRPRRPGSAGSSHQEARGASVPNFEKQPKALPDPIEQHEAPEPRAKRPKSTVITFHRVEWMLNGNTYAYLRPEIVKAPDPEPLPVRENYRNPPAHSIPVSLLPALAQNTASGASILERTRMIEEAQNREMAEIEAEIRMEMTTQATGEVALNAVQQPPAPPQPPRAA